MAFDTRKMLFPAQIAAREKYNNTPRNKRSGAFALMAAVAIGLSASSMIPARPITQKPPRR